MNQFGKKSLIGAAAIFLLVVGLTARVAPLADHDGRLLKQWPTEDGYLMLTIARNMALDRGMSTAAGEIPTNGTQPLTTFVWSLIFRAVDADREMGVLLVQVVELLVSLVAAFLLLQVCKAVFPRIGLAPDWALFCTAVWYSSPVVIGHSMNALESGVYSCAVLLSFFVFLKTFKVSEEGSIELSWPAILLLSGCLALAFYARNDAVFLVAAFCVVPLLNFREPGRLSFHALPKVLVLGALVVLAATPWLVNNLSNFGHLMPISGVAQSASTEFGDNIAYVFPAVFEYLTLVLPIPSSIETTWIVGAGLLVLLLAVAFVLIRVLLSCPTELRAFLVVCLCYSLSLVGYYGLLHGASWFMPRYLFPASPFFAITGIGMLAALSVKRLLYPSLGRYLASSAVICICVLTLGLNWRIYQNGHDHMHDQVVQWVVSNVPEDDWIGAVQTGTLGFFHERTVNLDGKVNPEALEALLRDAIPDYVNQRELRVIADWYGIVEWMEIPAIQDNYHLVLADPEQDVTILARNGWLPSPGIARPEREIF